MDPEVAQRDMSSRRRTAGWPALLVAGSIIGTIETIVAASLGALVFSGTLQGFLTQGVGLYLGAAVLTLAIIAWLAGRRGVVGGIQVAVAALLPTVCTSAVAKTFGSFERGYLSAVGA